MQPGSMASRTRLGWLGAAGVGAVLASACCLGPLLFVSLGLGGVWLGHLQALEPYRPIFLVLAAIALFVAFRRIFRPATCVPGQVCARGPVRRLYQFLFFAAAALFLVAVAFPYVAPLFY